MSVANTYVAHLVSDGAVGAQYDSVRVPLDGEFAHHFLAEQEEDGSYAIWETTTVNPNGTVPYTFAKRVDDPAGTLVIERSA